MILVVLQAAVSGVLGFCAFLGQMAFGSCGEPGSGIPCDFALGTVSFYAFIAVVIVLFAAVVAGIARNHARRARSWHLPLVGSSLAVLAYLLYLLMMFVATR